MGQCVSAPAVSGGTEEAYRARWEGTGLIQQGIRGPLDPARNQVKSQAAIIVNNNYATTANVGMHKNGNPKGNLEPIREDQSYDQRIASPQQAMAPTIGPQKPIQNNQKVSMDNQIVNWTKGELIGQGAFGSVYLGMNNDNGQLMAVKQVGLGKASVVGQAEQVNGKIAEHIRSLEAEVMLLKDLNHPNIVCYLGTERTRDALNIFLEYVPGGSIASLVTKFGSFKESVIRVYAKQILMGLDYLHSNGIIHRDIKGANILVDNTGLVKLADFGASKKIENLFTIESGYKSVKGTPYWMAPEVITQSGHGRQADIWSVACTIIEMATGKPPWSEYGSQVSAMFQIARQKGPPTIPEHLSPDCKDFLYLCFNRNWRDRPTASKLLEHPFLANVVCRTSAAPLNNLAGGIYASDESAGNTAVLKKAPEQKPAMSPLRNHVAPPQNHLIAKSNSSVSPSAGRNAQTVPAVNKEAKEARMPMIDQVAGQTVVVVNDSKIIKRDDDSVQNNDAQHPDSLPSTVALTSSAGATSGVVIHHHHHHQQQQQQQQEDNNVHEDDEDEEIEETDQQKSEERQASTEMQTYAETVALAQGGEEEVEEGKEASLSSFGNRTQDESTSSTSYTNSSGITHRSVAFNPMEEPQLVDFYSSFNSCVPNQVKAVEKNEERKEGALVYTVYTMPNARGPSGGGILDDEGLPWDVPEPPPQQLQQQQLQQQQLQHVKRRTARDLATSFAHFGVSSAFVSKREQEEQAPPPPQAPPRGKMGPPPPSLPSGTLKTRTLSRSSKSSKDSNASLSKASSIGSESLVDYSCSPTKIGAILSTPKLKRPIQLTSTPIAPPGPPSAYATAHSRGLTTPRSVRTVGPAGEASYERRWQQQQQQQQKMHVGNGARAGGYGGIYVATSTRGAAATPLRGGGDSNKNAFKRPGSAAI
jgi:serine/threonine protein kinase